MLYRTKSSIGKTLYRSKPLLVSAQEAYAPPTAGKMWFPTTTTVWRVDEMIRRRVRDWRRLTGETGHTGERTASFRKDHDSVYTGTHSVFPAPLIEWILLRYGGPQGSTVLDAFAGGPPRGLVSTIMGYQYTGFEIRQDQINENELALGTLGLTGAKYVLGDGRYLEGLTQQYDCALTCPPYYNLEKYSTQDDDLSNLRSYDEFNAGMYICAESHYEAMKPETFTCTVVGNFRDKKSGEFIDFRSHTVDNFREAGFLFWQDIVLAKNTGSAAKRSTNAWRTRKLVPCHEHLLIFKKG